VLTALAVPIVLMIWVYFAYAITVFRQDGAAIVDGPAITGNRRIEATWLIATSALVIGLAVFGTADLLTTGGAGGGEGPNPAAKPADWRKRPPGPGDRPAVAVDLPLPELRRRRDHDTRAPGQP
jgi:heme/copper-type cytochrome/quinol oxidase subunit 2